jgi:hypothetical protein
MQIGRSASRAAHFEYLTAHEPRSQLVWFSVEAKKTGQKNLEEKTVPICWKSMRTRVPKSNPGSVSRKQLDGAINRA